MRHCEPGFTSGWKQRNAGIVLTVIEPASTMQPLPAGSSADEPTFHIETLGCRVNQYDEEMLRREFSSQGFREVAFEEHPDVHVINTCTVTSVADKKSRQLIRRALRANPHARVIATGCAVGNRAALGGDLSGRVITVSNRQKDRLIDVVCATFPDHHARDESSIKEGSTQHRARALLKVQDGCNQFCTFCIVPFVRGRARSKPPNEVLTEARALVAAGFAEIVVTGVHVGWYGRDLDENGCIVDRATPSDGPAPTGTTFPWHLGRLMRLLAEQSGAPRLRLSSIEPADFPPDLLDTMVELGNICPHLHLALQHASDTILDRMHRGYTLAHHDALVDAFLSRFPDGALTADILVGFPGETDADFAILERYLQSRPYAHLHVFPYSKRPGTQASRLPDPVDAALLAHRMERVLSIGREAENSFRRRFVGRRVSVLVEEASGGTCRGTSDNYLGLTFDGPNDLLGRIVTVRATAVTPSGLSAVLEDSQHNLEDFSDGQGIPRRLRAERRSAAGARVWPTG